MKLKKNYKENIKIKDLAYLNELGAEIVEFYPKNDQLLGKLYVTGNYHSTKADIDKLISEDIPFAIVFENSDFLVEDIDCTKFEYNLIEGLGIEINYEISIEYSEEDTLDEDFTLNDNILNEETDDDERLNIDQVNEQVNEVVEEELNDVVENEIIKEEITNNVDQKLLSKLESVDDNLPQNEEIIRNLGEKQSTIKVVYYQNDRDLNNIASENNCSLDNLFKTNKQNNISTYKRVIIKNGK